MTEFTDIDIKFQSHPITGNLNVVKGINSIKQSIRNLVMMNKYESLDDYNQFTDISASLFDIMSEIEIYFFKTSIETILRNYEPRAEVVNVVYRNDLENNGFYFDIIFRPQNAIQNETIPVFFERIR